MDIATLVNLPSYSSKKFHTVDTGNGSFLISFTFEEQCDGGIYNINFRSDKGSKIKKHCEFHFHIYTKCNIGRLVTAYSEKCTG